MRQQLALRGGIEEEQRLSKIRSAGVTTLAVGNDVAGSTSRETIPSGARPRARLSAGGARGGPEAPTGRGRSPPGDTVG